MMFEPAESKIYRHPTSTTCGMKSTYVILILRACEEASRGWRQRMGQRSSRREKARAPQMRHRNKQWVIVLLLFRSENAAVRSAGRADDALSGHRCRNVRPCACIGRGMGWPYGPRFLARHRESYSYAANRSNGNDEDKLPTGRRQAVPQSLLLEQRTAISARTMVRQFFFYSAFADLY